MPDREFKKRLLQAAPQPLCCVQRAGLQHPRWAAEPGRLGPDVERGEAHAGSARCGRELLRALRERSESFLETRFDTDAPGPAGRGLVDADPSGDRTSVV